MKASSPYADAIRVAKTDYNAIEFPYERVVESLLDETVIVLSIQFMPGVARRQQRTRYPPG